VSFLSKGVTDGVRCCVLARKGVQEKREKHDYYVKEYERDVWKTRGDSINLNGIMLTRGGVLIAISS
jgi:hypothetical protein